MENIDIDEDLKRLGKLLKDVSKYENVERKKAGRKKGKSKYNEGVTTLGLVILFFIKNILEDDPNATFKKFALMKKLSITQYKIGRTLKELRDKELAIRQEFSKGIGSFLRYSLTPKAHAILDLKDSKSKLLEFLQNIEKKNLLPPFNV